mgnify:CR=1 FL=1
MIRKITVQLTILHLLFSSDATYNEKQMVKMMYEYFSSSKNSPALVGHRFYESSNEMIFQLELEADSTKVNETLIYGFESISKFSNISKTNFTHSILVIHFGDNILPVVAESNIECLKRLFIDASYSEKIRIESAGQIRMNYGNNAKQAYALRSTFRTITGHSSTGYQYVRFALLGARTPYRVYIGTTGGNYGPGAQFFTVLRSWDNTTLYVTDKLNIGSAYANAVRMQSDNGGGDYYLELSINLTTTSQGFNAAIIPIGANAGTNTTSLQFYGSGMSNLANTSSAQSL